MRVKFDNLDGRCGPSESNVLIEFPQARQIGVVGTDNRILVIGMFLSVFVSCWFFWDFVDNAFQNPNLLHRVSWALWKYGNFNSNDYLQTILVNLFFGGVFVATLIIGLIVLMFGNNSTVKYEWESFTEYNVSEISSIQLLGDEDTFVIKFIDGSWVLAKKSCLTQELFRKLLTASSSNYKCPV
jgi:hypothetical protein